MKSHLQLDEFDVYRVKPDQASAGLVVVQEIFGVNSHIRSVCSRWASFGFDAAAPALFDPVEKNVELGYTKEDIPKGRSLVERLGWDKALEGVAKTVEFLHEEGHERVFVMGFCWGGSVAYLSACRVPGIERAACYYGRHVYGLLDERPKVPVIFHYGKHDPSIPLSEVEAVRAALKSDPVYVYEAGHGFNCDQRHDYDEAAARLAERRTLEFFK